MVLKKLFGKKDEQEHEYTIDDLIVLERYEEAERKLQERIKVRNDLHDHLKLADCYLGMRQVAKAVDEYVQVAEAYAKDGFHDRALAILTKARRLNPMDDTLQGRVERMEQSKKLERAREQALEGFLEGQQGESRGTAVVEFQSIWRNLTKSRFLKRMSGEQLNLLFKAVEVIQPESSQVLVERGARDERLFIICSGEVVAQIAGIEGAPMLLRTFTTGQVIGDGALLERRPWPAAFKPRGRVTLLVLDQQGLQTCLTGNPDPTGFLSLLREEHNDRDVAEAVAKLERS